MSYINYIYKKVAVLKEIFADVKGDIVALVNLSYVEYLYLDFVAIFVLEVQLVIAS